MIIGTDFDNTVFRTGDAWERWYVGLLGENRVPLKDVDYDISSYYKQEIEDSADALSADFYFNRRDVYDRGKRFFITDAVKALTRLSKIGHKVWVITDCKEYNYMSKIMSCKKVLFADRVIRSGEKGKFDVDIMIDDRNECLNQFADKPNTLLIKYDTKYKQTVPLIREDVIVTNNWKYIGDLIIKESLNRGEIL